mmetsp:Transcript_12551/g.30504  ORF Transcript_12551/g.30504 Transcript_12551/m.30504 type:complete len:242 (+) Transcript_12551:510-1235(+)
MALRASPSVSFGYRARHFFPNSFESSRPPENDTRSTARWMNGARASVSLYDTVRNFPPADAAHAAITPLYASTDGLRPTCSILSSTSPACTIPRMSPAFAARTQCASSASYSDPSSSTAVVALIDLASSSGVTPISPAISRCSFENCRSGFFASESRTARHEGSHHRWYPPAFLSPATAPCSAMRAPRPRGGPTRTSAPPGRSLSPHTERLPAKLVMPPPRCALPARNGSPNASMRAGEEH